MELGIPRDATLATDAVEVDMNGDETDKDMVAYADLSPTSKAEEVSEQRRPIPIRYDPNCDHIEIVSVKHDICLLYSI